MMTYLTPTTQLGGAPKSGSEINVEHLQDLSNQKLFTIAIDKDSRKVNVDINRDLTSNDDSKMIEEFIDRLNQSENITIDNETITQSRSDKIDPTMAKLVELANSLLSKRDTIQLTNDELKNANVLIKWLGLRSLTPDDIKHLNTTFRLFTNDDAKPETIHDDTLSSVNNIFGWIGLNEFSSTGQLQSLTQLVKKRNTMNGEDLMHLSNSEVDEINNVTRWLGLKPLTRDELYAFEEVVKWYKKQRLI